MVNAEVTNIIVFRFKKLTVKEQHLSQIASFVPKGEPFDWSRESKLCTHQKKKIGHVRKDQVNRIFRERGTLLQMSLKN